MVAVAAVGTAASLFIPRYMDEVFSMRQQECPTELVKIVEAQRRYFMTYQGYTDNLKELDWRPPKHNRYRYGFRHAPRGQIASSSNDELQSSDLPETVFSAQSFRLGCVGNSDTDEELDLYIIDENGHILQLSNDLAPSKP